MLLEVRIDRLIPHMHSIIQVSVGQPPNQLWTVQRLDYIHILRPVHLEMMTHPAH